MSQSGDIEFYYGIDDIRFSGFYYGIDDIRFRII